MTNAKQETVKVVLEPDRDPPFHLESSLIKNGKLTFKNNHFPGFNVDFTIDDPTGSGYLFPSNPDLALGARRIQGGGGHCPAQGDSWQQFQPVSVSTDGKTLTVRNLNEIKTEFGFTLFVTQSPNPPNGPYLELDPIGDNQNGLSEPGGGFGSGSSSFASPTTLAIGAGVLIVALIALYQFGVFGR
jgi:hypothetical protein